MTKINVQAAAQQDVSMLFSVSMRLEASTPEESGKPGLARSSLT